MNIKKGSKDKPLIDCSKLSNKDDLMALIFIIVIASLFFVALYLSSINSFLAGFVSATIVWRWKAWIYKPLDILLDSIWEKEK